MTWTPITEFDGDESPVDVWATVPFGHRVPDACWHTDPADGGAAGFFASPDTFAKYFHGPDGPGELLRLEGVTHFTKQLEPPA